MNSRLQAKVGEEDASGVNCRFLPLSDAQREVWLACQISEEAELTYHEAFLIDLRGPLDLDTLRHALAKLLKSHDALNATFAADGSGVRINSPSRITLQEEVVPSALDSAEVGRWIDDRSARIRDRPMDLEQGPLCKFVLFKHSAVRHSLLIVAHHLVVDGWSWDVVLRDVADFYNPIKDAAALADRHTMQYADYVTLTETASFQERVHQDESYWLGRMADRPAELQLPSDRRMPPRRTYACGHIRRRVGPEHIGLLRTAARRHDSTVFQMLLATYLLLLHRLTGRREIIVGVPMAGQASEAVGRHGDASRLVGHCVNMLPVRVDIEEGYLFTDLLREVKQQIEKAREHQNVSFGMLLEKLRWPQDASRLPLVSVSITRLRKSQPDFGPDISVEHHNPLKSRAYFDLTVDIVDDDAGTVLDVKYNADTFDRATVERWLDEWHCLRVDAAATPSRSLCEMDILPPDERQFLTSEAGSGVHLDIAEHCTVHGVFQEIATRHPEAPAVVFRGESMTYRQLDELSSRLAQVLRVHGIRHGDLVGVCQERSALLVVSLLAVLKAGAAYVPIDPTYPSDRIEFVLEDAKCPLVLTSAACPSLRETSGRSSLRVDGDWPAVTSPGDAFPGTGSDLAYVIYTSGSTGRPKGVKIEHRSVVSFLTSMRRVPGIARDARVLAVTTISFDIAGLEIFLPLTTGASVVLASEDVVADGAALSRLLQQYDITLMQATPVTWRLLLDAGWVGKTDLRALCGGEPLPEDLAAGLRGRVESLWNMYGPTETTIWSTCSRISDPSDIHIGGPIANTTLRIVDRFCNQLPTGAVGELLIGGIGVARGYLGRPELDAAKFVNLPGSEGRFYRTGDLARIRSDGALECLGRLDFQVKIRGFRVETGEIESVLAQHASVRQAVVVARMDAGGVAGLVAYIKVVQGMPVDMRELKSFVRSVLPEYMVPPTIIGIAEFPLTPNGKLDRKALEARPIAPVQNRELVPLSSETEYLVARLYRTVLGTGELGATDSFFDLGGHSLAAARLMVLIRTETGINVPLKALFENPTVRGLALAIMSRAISEMASPIANTVTASETVSEQQSHNSIIPLNAGGTRSVIFGVPGHNGDVFCYRGLAAGLGSGHAMHGLQPPGLDGVTAPLTRVEDVAAFFARQILEMRVGAPVVIAGYCAGGAVAFELASQLMEAGRPVALLVLFGAPFPHSYRKWQQFRIRFIQYCDRLRMNWGSLLRIPKALNPFASNTALPMDDVTRMRRALESANWRAASRYEPKRLPVPVLQCLPNQQWRRAGVGAHNWAKYASSYTEFVGADSVTQDTMLMAPSARMFATVTEACIPGEALEG